MAGKDVTCLLIDVGPSMSPYLPAVEDMLFDLVSSKILLHPKHELLVIAYGSNDTDNPTNADMAAAGDPDQYLHIQVIQPLQCCSMETLAAVKSLPRGDDPEPATRDVWGALIVLADCMNKAQAFRKALTPLPKHVYVISDFTALSPAGDAEEIQGLTSTFTALSVDLHLVSVQFAEDVQQAEAAARAQTLQALDELSACLPRYDAADALLTLRTPGEMHCLFRSAYKSPTAAKQILTIDSGTDEAGSIKLWVRLYKTAMSSTLPSLKPYSDISRDPNAQHAVIVDTEYKLATNADVMVQKFETVNAYRYGKELVPWDESFDTKTTGERGMQLIGCVDKDTIPIFFRQGPSSVVLPDTHPNAEQALSALVRALHRDNRVAVVRQRKTARSQISMALLSPWLGEGNRPDCLVAQDLPFAENLRLVPLPGFDDLIQRYPVDVEQQDAMTDLVQALDLTSLESGGRGLPSSTPVPNPILKRMLRALGSRALDSSATVPPTDPLTEHVFQPLPQLHDTATAKAAVAAVERLWHLQEVKPAGDGTAQAAEEAAAKRAQMEVDEAAAPVAAFDTETAAAGTAGADLSAVGEAAPVEDFEAMAKHGRTGEAAAQLIQRIHALLARNVGGRHDTKLLSCVVALRQGCMDTAIPKLFNDFVQKLADSYAHPDFMAKLVAEGEGLIDEEECHASTISVKDAETFDKAYRTPLPMAAPSSPDAQHTAGVVVGSSGLSAATQTLGSLDAADASAKGSTQAGAAIGVNSTAEEDMLGDME